MGNSRYFFGFLVDLLFLVGLLALVITGGTFGP